MTCVTDHENVDLGAVSLYGLIEQLIRSRPHQADDQVSPGRGVARNHDALEAVVQLATAIEIPAQAGDLAPDKAYRMASLLLVIRDYIEPLATVEEGEAQEHLTRYLADVVDGLRQSPQAGR